jgi:phosphate transport system substrate-binding protein
MKINRLALGAAVALALAAPASAEATTLIGSGSTAAEPYLQALFQGYKKVEPSIQFIYTGDGGNAGVKDVQAGRSEFAGQSRAPLPSDAGTTYEKLFLDGLCLDVHPGNHISNLSIQQLSDIFTGTITNWSQIPGSGLSTTIDAFGRDSTAGTFTFFTTAVLNGATQGSNVTTQASDGLVANAVKQDPNSIGYIGLAYQGAGLKTLSVNGVACTAANIKSLTYPLNRYIWLVLPTASPNPAVQAFADWVRTSPAAGAIIDSVGGVAAFNQAPPKPKAKPKHKTKHKAKPEPKKSKKSKK